MGVLYVVNSQKSEKFFLLFNGLSRMRNLCTALLETEFIGAMGAPSVT
jgi:hypothetical protein